MTEKELWRNVLMTIIDAGFMLFYGLGWIMFLVALCHSDEFFDGQWNGVCVNAAKIAVPFIVVGYLFGYLSHRMDNR